MLRLMRFCVLFLCQALLLRYFTAATILNANYGSFAAILIPTFLLCILFLYRKEMPGWLTHIVPGVPSVKLYWDQLKYLLGLGPSFVLPDSVIHYRYPVRCNPHCEEQCGAAVKWASEVCNFKAEGSAYCSAAQFAELAALAYPNADASRFRVCADFMVYFSLLGEWLDPLDAEGTRKVEECCIEAMRDPVNFRTTEPVAVLLKSWFSRLEQFSSISCKEHMIESWLVFFAAVREQALYRDQDHTPGVEEYISIRRFTIGLTPSLVLTGFCGGYLLPDNVICHPLIQSLSYTAAEHIALINDIISYNKEQSQGDVKHNLVAIAMKTKGYNLQEAVDFVGEKISDCISRFERDRQALPSWGPEIDKNVSEYIAGHEFWMSGHMHWTFASARYLGNDGLAIRKHGIVKLRPKTNW